ncbi:CU044_5270 family protein [Streptomyces sp. NPDC058653]|uniref:CU044_5270 family protein n=1 Tax=Streptomyces sp. NPDC058653 TaxID=3346576 RepID=UPI0036566E07
MTRNTRPEALGPDPDFLDFPGADTLLAAGRVEPADGAAVEAARKAVLDAVARDTASPSAGRRPGLRRRRSVVAAVAVAAVAAGIFVLPVTGMDGAPPAASANAASFLRDVAATAAEKPAPNARYWKVERRFVGNRVIGVPDAKPVTEDQTIWFSRTSLVVSNPGGGKSTVCDGDYCTFPAGGLGQMHWSVGGKRITWDGLAALPTDPKALRAELLGGSTDSRGSVNSQILGLLGTAPAGPHLRAALFEVLAGMDGVRLVGPMKDREGRKGTGVEWRSPKVKHVLIVDPASSKLLEHRRDGKYGPSTVTFLSTGPVSALD